MRQVGLRVRQESPAAKETNVNIEYSQQSDCYALVFAQQEEGSSQDHKKRCCCHCWALGGAEGKDPAWPLGTLKAKRF